MHRSVCTSSLFLELSSSFSPSESLVGSRCSDDLSSCEHRWRPVTTLITCDHCHLAPEDGYRLIIIVWILTQVFPTRTSVKGILISQVSVKAYSALFWGFSICHFHICVFIFIFKVFAKMSARISKVP